MTAEGYKLGGLGIGVTGMNYTAWQNHNELNPLIDCGCANSLGNNSGILQVSVFNEDLSVLKNFNVPKYRGIENLYGHTRCCTDGVILKYVSESNTADVYINNSGDNFGIKNIDKYQFLTNIDFIPEYRWVKDILFGDTGDIIISEGGATADTFYYSMATISPGGDLQTYGNLILCFGYTPTTTNENGLFSFVSNIETWSAWPDGTRLCYLPN